MKRRTFIKNSGLITGGSILLNGVSVKAANIPQQFSNFTCNEIKDRILILVNMSGANDTLNTLIPVAQYSTYAAKRPKIKIPDSGAKKYIDMDTTLPANRQSGLHPVLTAFKDLYDQGKMNVVHGVGYADGNKSHFKSDELWNSAGDSTPARFDYLSGWAGNLFDYRYPGLLGNTNPLMPDPPCVELGANSGSSVFTTSTFNNASVLLAYNNINAYYNELISVGGANPAQFPTSDYGKDWAYIANVQKLSNDYGKRLDEVFTAGSNSTTVTYPANNYLADQFKTVARLIKGGAKTTLYLVHHYGYDTHGEQIDPMDSTVGYHANLLKELSQAIKAFQDDITALGFEDRVITATYSEFGRTIDENESKGTDHGEVSTMFIIGKGVNPGVTGNPIDLTKVVNRGLTDLQYDYRSVYAALLQDFLGHGTLPMTAARMQDFTSTKPPIIAATHKADPSCYINQQVLPVTIVQFKGKLNNDGGVDLFWETSSELNNKEFIIEYKNTDGDWINIGNVRGASAGYVTSINRYTFTHKQPRAGENDYRLKQIDRSGTFKIFGPVLVNVVIENVFVVKNYPNPATTEFNLTITTQKSQQLALQFLDHAGHTLLIERVSASAGLNKYNYPLSKFNNVGGEIIIVVNSSLGMKQVVRQIIQK